MWLRLVSSGMGRIALALAAALGAGWIGWRASAAPEPAATPSARGADAGPVAMPLDITGLQLTLGLTDRSPTEWRGAVSIDGGRILAVADAAGRRLDPNGWRLRTGGARPAGRRKQKQQAAGVQPVQLAITVAAPDTAAVRIETQAGEAVVRLGELPPGAAALLLGGAAAVERTLATAQLTAGPRHDDFPAAAAAPDGAVWCAYVSYAPGAPVDEQATAAGRYESLRARGNGDQVRLMRYAAGRWDPPLAVSAEGLDVWRPAVAVDGQGAVWVFWSQQTRGNWDLYGRRYDPSQGRFDPPLRLTRDPGPDLYVAAARCSDGRIWLAWQAYRGGDYEILLSRCGADGLEEPHTVSFSSANDWSPSLAAGPRGELWVAWDTYHKGDYDVYARRWAAGRLDPPQAVATSGRFEARPSAAVDRDGRVWIAFESGDFNWGKDYGPRLTGTGFPFYYQKRVVVRCLDQGRLLEAPAAHGPPVLTHYDDQRYQPEMKERVSLPRLAVDNQGWLWLVYRRHPQPQNAGGERWVSYARRLAGDHWSPEALLQHSEHLLDNRPALAPAGDGLAVVYATDGRTSGSRSAGTSRLQAAVLRASGRPPAAALRAAEAGGNEPGPAPTHPNEADEVRRCRQYRIEAGGKTYRLLRGEFHRHTEMSAHRDWDGPMEEVWRYGLDVAAMDWIGPGDHDYAVSQDYMWWLTQKQIDLHHLPGRFAPMFTYERSVSYPSGHRNVMFAQRGIRALPRLPGKENTFGDPETGSPDIQNLYGYLKYFDGICSSHTSATNMGTDWRDNDPLVEPVVEIFQGHRQNYEEPNAPLAPRGPEDAIQGYRPAGFVWEAFKKGIRLGFQSSSDHVSTHTSYAFVLAEELSREAVLDAFRRRHCYAANDNIILDVRCGPHIMGDAFRADGPLKLDVRVIGTAPIARVDIVRQVGRETPKYVYNLAPGEPETRFQWTDAAPPRGQAAMYYVRIQQENGRLAWASPMWIQY